MTPLQPPAATAPRPAGLGWLARLLRGGRTAADQAETRDLCQLARIGLWRQREGQHRVALSDELRGLLAVNAADPSEAEALACLHPDDRGTAAGALRRVRTTLDPAILEARVQHPQRGLRHTRWEVRAETDAQGRFAALTAVVQDITEWRAAEERRRQASRMDALGQLAAGLAHDFNNLLHTVTLNLDMLQECTGRVGAEPRARDLLQRARAATQHGSELTAQMLAFAGKHPAQRQPLDLALALRLAATAPATAAAAPDTRGVELGFADDVPAADGSLVVEADPMLLRASLHTLLARAQTASPSGGRVLVGLDRVTLDPAAAGALGVRPGAYADLSVADAGDETPPELLPRLFEPFFRAQPDGTDPTAAGVGLAMVHGFARSHGGAVELASAPAGGTVARLLLPLAPPTLLRMAAEPQSPPPATDPGAPLAGLRVLLVEDDADVRETTTMLLHEDGAVVTPAEDAAAALSLLASPAAFDFLLSDVVLPGGLNGIDVVERSAQLRPSLPAMLVSGYAAPAQELGRKLPAGVMLLKKPYRHADLLDAIAGTLPDGLRRSAA